MNIIEISVESGDEVCVSIRDYRCIILFMKFIFFYFYDEYREIIFFINLYIFIFFKLKVNADSTSFSCWE